MIYIIPPLRTNDKYGSGAYLASRGHRLHQGIDVECPPGSRVLTVSSGLCTKIGFPYSQDNEKKAQYRYIQITDDDGHDVRYFYVEPSVTIGDRVARMNPIGVAQDLQKIYPGITDHIHFEVKLGGAFINPHEYIEKRTRK